MSEKAVWNWLKKGLDKIGAKGTRLENCNRKGIADTLIRTDVNDFIELKDWSGPKKHPLSVEQRNFLVDFQGAVLVRTKKGHYIIWATCDLNPLLVCDVGYVEKAGRLIEKDYSNLEDVLT